MTDTYTDLSLLKGHTLTSVAVSMGGEWIEFVRDDGVTVCMDHSQDCCECARIEDIVGDPDDLVGSPLLVAEEASRDAPQEYGTGTWTFYRFRTLKGSVDIRWLGTSNGYYSESVDVYVKGGRRW